MSHTEAGKNKIHGRGEYQAICDSCGFAFMNFELLKRWDGMMVCKEDYETRHPSDFPPRIRTPYPLPFIRPDNTSVLIPPSGLVSCNPISRQARADKGTANCATLGFLGD